ncbi:MAG: ribosome-associated translation inhibitor RaiA [Bdellovibrionaceae bacterium]|nr:ribosome-associated translation inhibitor RaiA [Pseudobdellovibrionaceae bacterium]
MDNIEITFRNLEATEAIRAFALQRLERLHKYVSYNLKIHVLLEVEKKEHRAEVTCHAEHKELVSNGASENLYESIDLAVERMESQLRKERDKKKGHHTAHEIHRNSGHLAQDINAEIPHRAKKDR